MKDRIVTHPDNLTELRTMSDKLSFASPETFFGLEIIANEYLPRFRSEYRPPKDRFFDYDKSDHVWLKYFGMGGYVETKEPLFLQVKDTPMFPFRFTLGAMP